MRNPQVERVLGARLGPGTRGVSRVGHKVRSAVESGVLAGLLLVVVASAVVGSSVMLFGTVLAAWLALAGIVGLRNLLDAGCAYMLLVVGVILVVDLAANGPASLLH